MGGFWEEEGEDTESRWDEGGGRGRKKDMVTARQGRTVQRGGAGDKPGAPSDPRLSGLCIASSVEEEKLAHLCLPDYTFSDDLLSPSSTLCYLSNCHPNVHSCIVRTFLF